MLMSDPFRQLDRLTEQVFGTAARPATMALDAWREGNEFVVAVDLPGVNTESIDVDVEQNVLSIRAECPHKAGDEAEYLVAERPHGVFSRQLILGETLDT